MNNDLLDYIKKEKGFKRDLQLAKFYGISVTTISKIRNEERQVGSSFVVLISEDLNMPTREIFTLINRHRVAAAALALITDSGAIDRMIGTAEKLRSAFEGVANSITSPRKVDAVIDCKDAWNDAPLADSAAQQSSKTEEQWTEEQWRRNICKKARM